jgi:hypothetical protein
MNPWKLGLGLFVCLKLLVLYGYQGSSQGILACRASMRAPPAGMHETKKNFKFFLMFMFYACISLQNMQKCIAMHFCFPFIEAKCLFLTLH